MITIKGIQSSRRVWIDGKELFPGKSQAVFNHSPDGFNWGYAGSGPAQLALAILLKYTTKGEALLFHQQFKRDFIAGLPTDFSLSLDIADWFMVNKRERRRENPL